MANVNNVVLVGNLTRDIELRYTQGGTAVADLSLAVNNRTGKGENAKDEALYIDVTVWEKQAETAAEYLSKGSSVAVVGRLKMDTWNDKDSGAKRSKIGVVANTVQFLSTSKKNEGSSDTKSEDTKSNDSQESVEPNGNLKDPFEGSDDVPF